MFRLFKSKQSNTVSESWLEVSRAVLAACTLLPATTLQAAPIAGIQSVSAGYGYSCALTTGGGAKCWGDNGYGQLGDNTGADANFPVDVSGSSSNVDAISSGDYHSCLLTTSGGAQCWGYNDDGEVGDGTEGMDRLAPVGVTGLDSGIIQVAPGAYHSCALTSMGTVKCWGANWYGQLGDGTTTSSDTPVDVLGLSNVTALSAGRYHNCALLSGGSVKCWGYNAYGQLGDGTTEGRITPVAVQGLSNVTALSAGSYHNCAVTAMGEGRCWGYNANGQLGDGSNTNSLTPVAVSGLSGLVDAIHVGLYHSCALGASGGVSCWGYNGSGQLGNGSWTDSNTPVAVSGLESGVTDLGVGNYHNCAVVGGGAKCWGGNWDGQLGDGTLSYRNTPVDVLTDGLADDTVLLQLEEPAEGSVVAGVGNIRGWAVPPYSGISHVDYYLDGVRKASIPFGGKRGDVAGANPTYPEALRSGFAQSYNYGLLDAGPHQVKVRAYSDSSGGFKEVVHNFNVVKFASNFINNPANVDVSSASCSQNGNGFQLNNVLVEGLPYSLQIQWQTPTQQFDATEIQPNPL